MLADPELKFFRIVFISMFLLFIMAQNSSKKERFNRILKDIKSVKIQGARNIARKALYAYSLIPTKKSKKLLVSSRPTEPMLRKVLKETERKNYEDISAHFDFAQKKINENVLILIKQNDIIFTHCHSTNVSNALIYAKRMGKKFQVYNTETRPLMQGRKTARELKNAGIKVTMFVDSALDTAMSQGVKKIFIGADALLNDGIINKIGSNLMAKISNIHKIPLYIVADSWKFTEEKITIEKRSLNEIWNNAPKKIKIQNPAFEFVPKKYIKAIISEFGILKYDDFVRKVKQK